MTDLELHIETTPMADTHEHLNKEADFVNDGPDILQSLFDHYVAADLFVAGASAAAVQRLRDAGDPDLRERFAGVREAWERTRFTGYGEGVRWVARELFGIDHIDADAIERAATQAKAMHAPGQRLRLLREVARLDHVQVDHFEFQPDTSEAASGFFFYDLSWLDAANGKIKPDQLLRDSGVAVHNLATLREAYTTMFARHAKHAIAVKCQHAYDRTLRWQPREDADAASVLSKKLAGLTTTIDEDLCLGDWSLARGVELASVHNLPVKIHTGYYAGHSRMPLDRVHASHLCGLIAAYPDARFVLMHTAYPFGGEVVAMAKHYRNVYADLCWAWSIDPLSSENFVRQMIHTVPLNKLFVYGGDSFWPHASAAFAWQARRGLTRALQAEIRAGDLSEREAIEVASQFMIKNQRACFDLEGTRAAVRAAHAG